MTLGCKRKKINCRLCGHEVADAYGRQLYCRPCSVKAHLVASAKSYRKTGGTYDADLSKARRERKEAEWRANSIKISKAHASSLMSYHQDVKFEWIVKISVPFSRYASKNAKYGNLYNSHTETKQLLREWKQSLTGRLRDALSGRQIRQNKLWVEIFVQKLNHRSDAINLVDTVCDALKESVSLDDRWFCLSRVDWEIVKHNPKVFVAVGQEDLPDVQACSYCGRLLEFHHFTVHRSNKNGIHRVCRECTKVDNVIARRGHDGRM